MIYGSLCSGIEAATMAWHPLGWKAAFFSEIDKFPSAVLKHYYPEVPNLGDMNEFKDWPDATIDVLVGGTPCQSFSVAGLRKGLADPRGNLTLTYLAIAARYRPQWVVWENVPGVLSDKTGAFGAFLGGLGQLGYGFAYRILDAQYFGVPQRRRRVFVVGCFGDWRRAAAVLFERHSLQGNPPPSREAGKGFAEATARSVAIRGRDGTPQAELGDDKANTILAPNGGRGGIGVGAVIAPACAPCLTQNYGKQPDNSDTSAGPMLVAHAPDIARCIATREGTSQDYETTTMVAHSLRADGFDANEDGTGRGTPLVPVAFDCKASGQSGFGIGNVASTMRSMGHTKSHQNGGGHLAVAFQENMRGEVSESEVSYPLKTGGGKPGQGYPATLTGMRVRRLTPRECERLQGFPDDYTLIPYNKKPSKDGPRYKALGNSMAVPVMRWIGERIEAVNSIEDAA